LLDAALQRMETPSAVDGRPTLPPLQGHRQEGGSPLESQADPAPRTESSSPVPTLPPPAGLAARRLRGPGLLRVSLSVAGTPDAAAAPIGDREPGASSPPPPAAPSAYPGADVRAVAAVAAPDPTDIPVETAHMPSAVRPPPIVVQPAPLGGQRAVQGQIARAPGDDDCCGPYGLCGWVASLCGGARSVVPRPNLGGTHIQQGSMVRPLFEQPVPYSEPGRGIVTITGSCPLCLVSLFFEFPTAAAGSEQDGSVAA
jgi:hypothetical protein